MPRRGKRGKPNGGFPSFPPALGNRQHRDYHIPTGPATRLISTQAPSGRIYDLDTYAECKAAGVWPGYPETVQVVSLPNWAFNKE